MRKAIGYAALVLASAFLVLPFVWMVLVSLHPSRAPIPELSAIVPREPQWDNYRRVLADPQIPVGRFFFNSFFVSVAVVAGQLLVASLCAFALARLEFPGRTLLFWVVLASMMFAGVVTQIPVYLMMREAGWLNSYLALIVPGLSSSFSIFLLRQAMVSIPKELDEAACLDGAGPGLIYWRVILPLVKPALAACCAFTFVASWTDFFWPLLVTNSTELHTLEVGLSIFKNSYGATNWPLQMAAAVLTLLPLVALLAVVQRWFVAGIQITGLK